MGTYRPSRRHVVGLVAAAALVLLLGACGGNGGGGSSTPAATRSPAPATGTRAAGTPSATATAPSGGAKVNDEPVAFATTDGVTIRGHLYSTPGPQRKAVIFAHMFPSDQRSWTAFAQEVAATGIAALTLDFRGYGETGGSKDVPKIDRDLSAAVRFLKARDYPQVYLVGASMGGTAALKVAVAESVAGVVTVSAPVEFQGLDARNDVPTLRMRLLFIASRDDGSAPASAGFFMQNAPGQRDAQILEGSAHGTDLLKGSQASAFKQLVLDFLNR